MAALHRLDQSGRDDLASLQHWQATLLTLVMLLFAAGPVRGQEDPKPIPQAKTVPPKQQPADREGASTPPKVLPRDSAGDAESTPIEAPQPPAPPTTLRQRARQLESSRSPILRLASVPNMFGDLFSQSGQVQIGGVFSARADIPTAGVLGRSKVSENNKAVTMDRVYFMVNHFQNALEGDANTLDLIPATDLSVDRYTLGIEKRFLDQLWSVDLRVPLINRYDFGVPKFGVAGDELGNVAVTLKRQLVANCTTGVVAGLGIDVPTGGDLSGHAGSTNFTLQNDAVHLSPYVGFMRAPNDTFFYHGFWQVDVPLNGNRIDYVDPFNNVAGQFGRLQEQTLMHCDLSVGSWLYRNRCAPLVTGLASVVELHYTTTLDDSDLVRGTVGPLGFNFSNVLNRIDALQFTVGLHADLGPQTTFRVGGAFPLNRGAERPFDAEVLVSLNRRF